MAITSAAIGGGLASLMALYAKRERLYYHPSTELTVSPRHMSPPVDYEDVTIFGHSPSSTEVSFVHGWWVPSNTLLEEPNYTILHCHGNAGNIGDRLPFIDFVKKYLGECNVLLFDYPGFGRLGSRDVKPSNEGCFKSTEMAFKWLIYEKEIPAEKIILWGESIGCVFASALVANSVRKPAGLLLQTPFTSMSDMVKYHYTPVFGLIPSLFVKNELDTVEYLVEVVKRMTPIVMLHAPDDEIVPYSMAEKLRKFATSYGDLSGTHNSTLHEDHINITYLVRHFLMT